MIRPFMLHDRIKACTLSTGQVRAVFSTSGGIGQRSGDPMSTDQRSPDAMRRKTLSHEAYPKFSLKKYSPTAAR